MVWTHDELSKLGHIAYLPIREPRRNGKLGDSGFFVQIPDSKFWSWFSFCCCGGIFTIKRERSKRNNTDRLQVVLYVNCESRVPSSRQSANRVLILQC